MNDSQTQTTVRDQRASQLPAERQQSGAVDTSPPAVIARMLQSGMQIADMKAMLEIQERWEANEARKAFNAAFAAFKSEAVKIIKGTEVKDGPLKGKFHANLFDVVNGTTSALSKHGLTIAWKLTKDDPAWMEVTCTLRHANGHLESVSMGGAPDTGPGRNAIQARGSSKTYLERYTATAILGLAAQDADNDGNAPPPAFVAMTQDHQLEVQAKAEEISKTTLGAVLKSYKAKKLEDIPESEYASIMHRLEITAKGKA